MNISFIESVISHPLPQSDRNYLNAKVKFSNDSLSSCNGIGCFLSRQIGHIAFTPYKIISLVAQTIVDIALIVLVSITACSKTRFEEIQKELLGRSYNLLVADTFIWLSIVPSLIYYPIYTSAQNLHLGSFRAILSA